MPKPLEQELLEELTSLAAELGSSATGNSAIAINPGTDRAKPGAASNNNKASASNSVTNSYRPRSQPSNSPPANKARPQAQRYSQPGQSVLQRAQIIADSHRIEKKHGRKTSTNTVTPQQVALPL
ncbi:MAG: hypothetical protein WBN40_03940 [Pseudomonadales bacterium]